MNHLPFQVAHHWITRLTQLPHPITIENISALAADFNWEPTNEIDEYNYKTEKVNFKILAPFDKETREVFAVSIPLAINPERIIAEDFRIADAYLEYTQKAAEAWGKARDYTTNTTGMIWKIHNQAYVELYIYPGGVIISFERSDPNGLGWPQEEP